MNAFFDYVTTVLYLSGLVRDHTGTFLGSEEASRDQAPHKHPRNGKPAAQFRVIQGGCYAGPHKMP